MRFTNLSARGRYFQCCHREVAPLGSFSLPWADVRADRAVRAAMSAGVLAWESEGGDPFVEGSPEVPRRDPGAEARAEEARAAAAREVEERRERDNRAVAENMARMGRFDVPSVAPYTGAERREVAEAPATEADVIPGAPRSLADIRRHNMAVRRFGRAANAGKEAVDG